MKKGISLLLALLMMTAVLAGCGDGGSGGQTGEKVLQMRLTSALQSSDWQATTLQNDMRITWVDVFEGLYGLDEANGGYYNLLAKDVAASEDGLTYTITLQDATFQNGDPLTAEDVVFSYEKAKENSRFNYVTSFINSVEAQDEKTVVMHLDYPNSAIAHTFWTVKIYSKAEYTEATAGGKEFGTTGHTAGTGPYILKGFDATGADLEAYENYWGGAPNIKKVRYQVIADNNAAVIAFKNGELDYFPDVPTTEWEAVKAEAGENCQMVKANDIHWLAVNYLSPTNNGILSNPKVREAIAWAINKEACVMAATSGYGTPAYEYMPHEYVATAPDYTEGGFQTYDYNIEKAKQCMLEAGYTEADMAAGIPVGDIITYGDASTPRAKEAVVIQSNLAEIGLKAEVVVQEYAVIGPRMYSQDYDLAVFGDVGNYDFNNIRQQVHSESVGMYLINYAHEDSPFDWQMMEQLVADGIATADTNERKEIYTKLWAYVMDTDTILPILHTGNGAAWSERINVPSVCPTYYHISQWSWVE